jgi:Holliday junction resolvase RusA-like endonuclease
MEISKQIQRLNTELSKDKPNLSSVKRIILDWYYTENDSEIRSIDDLEKEKLDEIVRWMNRKEMSGEINLFQKKGQLKKLFYQSLSSKVSFVSQYHCPFCSQDYPTVIMNIRIRPQSYQSLDSNLKKAFKAAVNSRINARNDDFKGCKICLHIVYVCSEERREKDLDNMSKLLLDAIKDILFDDDAEVDHLNVMKIKNSDNEEYITVNIRKSNLNTTSDLLSPFLHHSWAGAEMLELEDFNDP